VAALQARFTPQRVAQLAAAAPRALALDVAAWADFLGGWAAEDAVWRALRYRWPALTATNVHRAGRAILFVRTELGWSDADVARRVLPIHTRLLCADEADLRAALARLKALGLNEGRVDELLFECPGLLYDFADQQLGLAERAFERSRAKYAFMGSYEV
jgi:hypothetical protein